MEVGVRTAVGLILHQDVPGKLRDHLINGNWDPAMINSASIPGEILC